MNFIFLQLAADMKCSQNLSTDKHRKGVFMMMYVYKTLLRFPFTFKEPQRGESEIHTLHQFESVFLDCFFKSPPDFFKR